MGFSAGIRPAFHIGCRTCRLLRAVETAADKTSQCHLLPDTGALFAIIDAPIAIAGMSSAIYLSAGICKVARMDR